MRGGEHHDLVDAAARIDAPTLVLWGEHDRVVPFAVAEGWAERLPNATLVLVPETGHSPQLERGENVGRLIETFLETPST